MASLGTPESALVSSVFFRVFCSVVAIAMATDKSSSTILLLFAPSAASFLLSSVAS